MVKCWNCEYLMRVHSGKPSSGKLFAEESYQCKIKKLPIGGLGEIRKERECEKYKESKRWLKI